ncbi:MAG: hypothetical protein WC499_02440 [Patescibacteria group bacterium]
MLQVKVNTVDISDQISFPSLSVKQQLSSTVDTANFTVKKYGDKTFTPAYNDEVEIYDGAVKIFGGRIVEIKESTESLPNEKIYAVSCIDHSYEMDSILVARTYTSETIGDIIADLIADFTPVGSGFTSNNAVSTFVITKIVFNQIPISQCLRRLADIVKYEWYVDEEKDIHFFPKFTTTAPFNMVDGKYMIKSYERGIDGSQLVNRVKVRGGLYDGATFSDTITVKGSATTSFKLPYKFSNLTISVNGTPKVVGVDFVDDFTTKDVLYNYTDQSFHFENALTDGDAILYSGNPKIPVLAIAEDGESISLYGAKEKLIKDTSLISNVTARKRASAELYVYADSVIDASFSTYESGLRAGQIIVTPEGDSMFIKSVVFASLTPFEFRYNISLISTQKYELIDLLRKIIAPENESIDENEVSEQIYTTQEEMNIVEEIDFVTPLATEDIITFSEDIQLNPFDPADIRWVYGFYFPSSISDVKRMARFDRGAKFM